MHQQKKIVHSGPNADAFVSGLSIVDTTAPAGNATITNNNHNHNNKTFKSNPVSPSAVPIPPSPLRSSDLTTDSSSSSRTIRSPKQLDASDMSAYPFPATVALMKPNADQSLKPKPASSTSRHEISDSAQIRKKSRKVRLPVKTDLSRRGSLGPVSKDHFLPPGAVTLADDDSPYPSPNLYDLTLSLNLDPGLDGWWSNLVEILKSHYGAERATLTVPGDATDLENVPWGQKATYCLYGYKPSACMSSPNTEAQSTPKNLPRDVVADPSKTASARDALRSRSTTASRRPSLMARHSFAGFGKRGNSGASRDRDAQPEGLVRTKSISESSDRQTGERCVKGATDYDETDNLARRRSGPDVLPNQVPLSAPPNSDGTFLDDTLRTPAAAVFPVPRVLEVESDPLIKRTGVVRLFGRAKPAILTREYVNDPMSSPTSSSSPVVEEESQTTPGAEIVKEAVSSGTKPNPLPSNIGTNSSDPSLLAGSPESSKSCDDDALTTDSGNGTDSYEEYEQTPQSPWAQSPAPSPAPRSNQEENPFFNPKVDEEAFASSPPSHDYSKKQPLEAIGIDCAKTIVHIPLLHSSSSKQPDSDTLRFPVAIISFLTSIIPYPSNLRQSLTYLLPHLTTSFCLAQQYSQLEKQLSTSSNQRYGHILGLGGTFSDASSELELVAGLSGHVNYPLGEEAALSGRSGLSSPINASALSRATSSTIGTPGVEPGSVGPRQDYHSTPNTASKLSNEVSDSYFNMKNSSQYTNPPQRSRQARAVISSPPSELRDQTIAEFDELAARDPGLVPTPSIPEVSKAGSNFVGSPYSTSRQASSASIATQLHRDLPTRPFPDTIAQLMLNSVPLHLFLAKPHTGEVIWTNSKFDAFRRSQPQEQRVRDPWQNVHESERDNLQNEWSKALRTGSQFTERVRVKRFNDENAYRWFIFRANPLLSGTGELLYWIGSFLDVHEQHVAELKAAQEREMFARDAKFKALANSIPQVVFEATEYRGLISANEQWQLYTGQSLEEAQNLGFAKHIHRDDLEKCGILLPPQVVPDSSGTPEFGHIISNQPPTPDSTGSASASASKTPQLSRSKSVKNVKGRHNFQGVTHVLHDLVKKGVVTIQQDENGRDSYTTEVRFRSKGGDFRWHLVRLVKVETPDFGNGDPSWYGTCTDINDRKLLERELNTAMQKLNNEMESKTKFFSNMSHEIRTPLNGILGTIPFILDTQLDNDQRRMLDTIQNSSTNLRELVDNILDVSKVEAGKMNMVQQWFHVRSILEDVIDTIGSRAIDKGLELNYLVELDVPPMVIGDRFRIRQILINLMGNAVKFTSQGEIYTHCSIYYDSSVSLEESEILLNFEVVDTGKGFSSRDAERLMQRFSQIESSGSQQHAGSGLGLFLSKQLVEMHGGRLTPTSKEGQGAKFSFFVKVKAPPPSQPDEASNFANAHANHSPNVKTVKVPVPSAHDMPSLQSPTNSEPSSQSSLNRSADSSTSSTTATTVSSTGLSPLKTEQQPSPIRQSHLEVPHQTLPATNTITNNATLSQSPEQDTVAGPMSHPTTYSVLIICPFDHAREAVKQHIEQIIPHDVPSNVTTVMDVEDWKDMMNSHDPPVFTHLALSLPDANDVMEVLQYVAQTDLQKAPALVVVADLYQKRAISDRYKELQASGKKVFVVPKPVKPSAFAKIFDPNSKRDLSKDRNQDMAREVNNNFKTMSKIVKEVIGNKGYRILLVEDDETNRTVSSINRKFLSKFHYLLANQDFCCQLQVMLKYLEKVKLVSETAGNGQECIDMVFSKEPGYYSLIIVSNILVIF